MPAHFLSPASRIANNRRGSVRSTHTSERDSVRSTHTSERGSVEAGLAIIPTTLFFLLVLQIVLAGSWQVVERSRLHDLIIKSEISGEEVVADSLGRSRVTVEREEISGVGDLLRYEVESEIPLFSALSADRGSKLVVRNRSIRID